MDLISDHRQWFSYRGLSSHKFMPMLGVHKTILRRRQKSDVVPHTTFCLW